MADGVTFLVAPLALAIFGLPAAWMHPVSRFSAPGRFSAAFVAGTVVYTVWLTLLSAAGIRWSDASVIVPLTLLSIGGALVLARRKVGTEVGEAESGSLVWWAAAISIASGTGHLVLMALTSRATSVDYLYFWGVKAQRFAALGGIDTALLTDPLAVHMHSNYPPLVPIVYAWGISLAGRLPWQMGLASCAAWLLAGLPLLRDLLARRLHRDEATLAASFWFLALALALPAALSAGNAEPPMVLFVSVAIAALLEGSSRWLAIVALSGVVLTKNEGLIVFLLIAAGGIARDLAEGARGARLVRRAAPMLLVPLAALGSWLLLEALRGVPMGDATRERAGELALGRAGDVVAGMVRNLDAGSAGLAWLVAVAIFVAARRRWRALLPAIVPAAGTLAFLFVYYLHFRGDELDTWMRWTMPRVSLSALAAALVGAAFAAAPDRRLET
ncbi:MAG: hypothetical protein HYU52_16480 [Acidobacteria bacterium]|nr:hypothetical protein [Acidobacteriota bacterium]